MTLRELMEWGIKFQIRRFREEETRNLIRLKCPECGKDDLWKYDIEKKGHRCKKCGYFQEDL